MDFATQMYVLRVELYAGYDNSLRELTINVIHGHGESFRISVKVILI